MSLRKPDTVLDILYEAFHLIANKPDDILSHFFRKLKHNKLLKETQLINSRPGIWAHISLNSESLLFLSFLDLIQINSIRIKYNHRRNSKKKEESDSKKILRQSKRVASLQVCHWTTENICMNAVSIFFPIIRTLKSPQL